MVFNTPFRRTFCAGILLTVLCAAGASAQPVDLLLIAADDAALQPLVKTLDTPRIEQNAAWTIWTGRLAGKSVALTRSEGDPLNAVAATTLAVRHHPPRLIVVFGPARPHDPALRAGDVVVSKAFVAFDGVFSPRAELGEGTHPLKWQVLPHYLMTPGEKEVPAESFPADASALKVALALEAPSGRVLAGVLGSANQVNREVDRIAWIREHFHTSCEDGESAHVAGCAELLGVPVIGMRVIEGTDAAAASFALQFVEAWK